MKTTFKTFCLIFIISLINLSILAQQSESFEKFMNEKKEYYRVIKEKGLELHERLGIPLRGKNDSQEFELKGLDGNRLLYYATDNSGASLTTKAFRLYPNGGRGISVTGSGYNNVAVWDGGLVRTAHQEFGVGRVAQQDGASALSNHATHVSGTIAASGVDPNAKGVAFQTNLKTYDWTDDSNEMSTAAAAGLELSNHSYGYLTGWYYGDFQNLGSSSWYWFGDENVSLVEAYTFGFYSGETQTWDNIAVNYPNYLIIKSAGNDRGSGPASGTQHYYWNGTAWVLSTTARNLDGNTNGYDCIIDIGNAKNILTIGAVSQVNDYQTNTDVIMSSFSGWGPTDDGRIKPDIVAKGVGVYSSVATADNAYSSYNGTSMSSPNTTGSLVLVQQYYKSIHSGVPLKSATLKGLVIHTAEESGTNLGPDYSFGWGLLNVDKAVLLIQQDIINNNVIQELSLNNSGTYTVDFVANGNEPLKATICWTDPAATPLSSNLLNNRTARLINDLDLKISKDGTDYFPWKLDPENPSNAATRIGKNSVDNVEVVLIENPVAGSTYTITVDHSGTIIGGSQPFALLVSGVEFTNTRFVDGSSSDWKGNIAETAHLTGYSEGEFIYKGVGGDERTDYSATQSSLNNDLLEVRFGQDGTSLFIYAKMNDITDINYPHLSFVVTNGTSTQNFIGDDSKRANTNSSTATSLGAAEQNGILVDIHTSESYKPVIELFNGGTWYAPPSNDHQVYFNAVTNVIEARINLTDLGLTPASNTKISLMTAPNRTGWNNDVDATAWLNDNEINGVDVMTPSLTNNNAWVRDLNDGDVDSYASVNLTTAPLPVELISFTANINGNNVVLNWQTATEINNYGFEIERSQTSNTKGEKWELVGFEAGYGNSNSPKKYFIEDETVTSGNYSYRLKQIDFDGQFEYSEVISIEVNSTLPKEFSLSQNYPNPFNPVTSIEYTVPQNAKGETSNVKLVVYDVLGNEVAVLVNGLKEAGSYEVNFDAASLSSGIYFYSINAENFYQVRKMMLVK